jgi:hypothetical protein
MKIYKRNNKATLWQLAPKRFILAGRTSQGTTKEQLAWLKKHGRDNTETWKISNDSTLWFFSTEELAVLFMMAWT